MDMGSLVGDMLGMMLNNETHPDVHCSGPLNQANSSAYEEQRGDSLLLSVLRTCALEVP